MTGGVARREQERQSAYVDEIEELAAPAGVEEERSGAGVARLLVVYVEEAHDVRVLYPGKDLDLPAQPLYHHWLFADDEDLRGEDP